jgi:ribosomal protein L30/L7E
MGRVERSREIARRRKRRDTLRKLRAKFRKSTSESEKSKIVGKVRRISPFVNLEAETAAAKAK